MASAIGWYWPLVDLCRAASHLGDFVQLLVFVHRCTPVKYKLSKGGEVIRTDIQVGDDTLPFFSVSLWQRQMGTMAIAGDVILLQNVKITKFGQVVEARTVQCSSLLRLVYSESLLSRGKTTIEKLRKVIVWAQRVTSSLYTAGPYGFKVYVQAKLFLTRLSEKLKSPSFSNLDIQAFYGTNVFLPPSFGLYVWDRSEYLPLFVRNNATELLFGNIRTERLLILQRTKTSSES